LALAFDDAPALCQRLQALIAKVNVGVAQAQLRSVVAIRWYDTFLTEWDVAPVVVTAAGVVVIVLWSCWFYLMVASLFSLAR
jgi:hypothetical protein